jgi:hypothetical protein
LAVVLALAVPQLLGALAVLVALLLLQMRLALEQLGKAIQVAHHQITAVVPVVARAAVALVLLAEA